MKNVQLKKGFTLIELLIVIAIIAVLAVAFLPSLMGAPSKSRDTQRITSITKLSNFLMTQTLTGKSLPATNCIDNGANAVTVDKSISKLVNDSLPEFGGSFPVDPKDGNATTGAGKVCTSQYGYILFNTANVKGYSAIVYAAMENIENANIACEAISDSKVPVLSPGKVASSKDFDPKTDIGCYAGLVQ